MKCGFCVCLFAGHGHERKCMFVNHAVVKVCFVRLAVIFSFFFSNLLCKHCLVESFAADFMFLSSII